MQLSKSEMQLSKSEMQLSKSEMQLFSFPDYHKGTYEKTDKPSNKTPKPYQKIKYHNIPKSLLSPKRQGKKETRTKKRTRLHCQHQTRQNKTKQNKTKHSNSNTTINWLQIIKQTRVPLFHNATTFYHRTTRTDSYYKIKIKKIKKKYLGYSMFGFILFFLYV